MKQFAVELCKNTVHIKTDFGKRLFKISKNNIILFHQNISYNLLVVFFFNFPEFFWMFIKFILKISFNYSPKFFDILKNFSTKVFLNWSNFLLK